jgi:hypothetical protein
MDSVRRTRPRLPSPQPRGRREDRDDRRSARRLRTEPRARLTDTPLRTRARCQLCGMTVAKSTPVCAPCSARLEEAIRTGRLTQKSVDRYLGEERGDVLQLVLLSHPHREENPYNGRVSWAG